METEGMQGGLWLTAMGRIVLDDHNNERYCEPYDRKIMTKEELTNGMKLEDVSARVAIILLDRPPQDVSSKENAP